MSASFRSVMRYDGIRRQHRPAPDRFLVALAARRLAEVAAGGR
jgi:hypothetical protein